MIKITPLPGTLSMRDPAVLIATGFGAGRISPAPGTWGTLAAFLLGLSMSHAVMAMAVVIAVAAGLWAAGRFEKNAGSHDSGMIVIDEWAGMWVAMLFAAPLWDELILAFLAFRAFDIAKPWPIGLLDRKVGGAWGVMVDDLVAGLAAGIVVFWYGVWMH